MTVADLIVKLQAMPQDIAVTIRMCSDDQLLLDDEPTLITPEQRWIVRNGTYMAFNPRTWDYQRDGEPVFVYACHFPGN